jgi:hypothetical protein
MFGNKKETRFEVVQDDPIKGFLISRVIKDKETGVLYLFHGSGQSGGITPLLDKEGDL